MRIENKADYRNVTFVEKIKRNAKDQISKGFEFENSEYRIHISDMRKIITA